MTQETRVQVLTIIYIMCVHQTFILCDSRDSEKCKIRSEILKEFLSVADNMNFGGDDKEKLRTNGGDPFVKDLRQVYGIYIQIEQHGATNTDYKVVWDTLTSDCWDILTTVKELIQKEEEEGRGMSKSRP